MDYLLEKFPEDILWGHLLPLFLSLLRLYFFNLCLALGTELAWAVTSSIDSYSGPGTMWAFSWLQSPCLNVKHPLCGPHFCLSLRALTMVVNIAHWWATPPIPFGAFSEPPWKVNYQLEEPWGFSTTCHRNSMATSVQSPRDYMHLGKPGVLSFILGLLRLVTKALPGSLLAEGYFWNGWMLMY